MLSIRDYRGRLAKKGDGRSFSERLTFWRVYLGISFCVEDVIVFGIYLFSYIIRMCMQKFLVFFEEGMGRDKSSYQMNSRNCEKHSSPQNWWKHQPKCDRSFQNFQNIKKMFIGSDEICLHSEVIYRYFVLRD